MSGFDTITLAPAPFFKGAIVKSHFGDKRGVKHLLSMMQGFQSRGAMHAHRYNGQPDGTHMAPPSGGGQLPREYSIPADAVYVVWSYGTPIAWVDSRNRVTIPDVKYSVTTTYHQTLCRVYIPSAQ